MRRLVWKELMEQRWIPLGYAALSSVVILMWYTMSNWTATHGGMATDRMTPGEASFVIAAAVVVSGLISASSSISSEVHQNTSTFLDSLPASRRRIWTAKVVGSLAVTGGTVMLAYLAYALLTLGLFRVLPNTVELAQLLGTSPGLLWEQLAANAFLCFSISLYFSSLLDRPLAAAGSALVGTIAVIYGIVKIGSWILYGYYGDVLLICIAPAYAGVCFLAASALVYCQIANKGLRRALVCSIFFVCAFGVGFGALALWRYAGDLSALSEPVPMDTLPYGTIVHPSGSTGRQGSYELEGYKIERTEIGHRYLGVAYARKDVALAYTINSSPEVRSELLWQTDPISRRFNDKWYFVLFSYEPRLPLGNDRQEVDVVDTRGRIVERIVIEARKVQGFFPPSSWFDPYSYNGFIEQFLNGAKPVPPPKGIVEETP